MALISNVIKPISKSVLNSIYDGVSRFVYNFDGVDDRGSLQFRAINPDGDNTFEFWTPPALPTSNQSIISQSVSSSASSREFDLFFSTSGNLLIIRGGTQTTLFSAAQGVKFGTKYGMQQTGDFFQIFEGGLNGPRVRTITALSGTAREQTAQTLIGCRASGSGIFSNFFQGGLRDIKINGVLYPIADRNQPIQLPQPSGLGAELITPSVLESPAAKGTQWTYLGNGRWRFVGDGTLNSLDFISGVNQPEAGFVEFEVESYSGAGFMTCAQSNATGRFNSVGIKRYFFTTKGGSGENTLQFKRADSVPISCIIKNISFKPLGSCNPLVLTNTTSDRWQEIVE